MRATTAPAGGFPLGLATAAAMGRNLPLPANRSIRLPVARKAQSGGPRYRSRPMRLAHTKVPSYPRLCRHCLVQDTFSEVYLYQITARYCELSP
jgi:hypothetical protein